MESVGLRAEPNLSGREDRFPFIERERAKDGGWLPVAVQTKFRDRARHQLRPILAPRGAGGIGAALAEMPIEGHEVAAGRHLDHGARRDVASVEPFARENVRFRKCEWFQANHISIDPPASLFQQELVAKEIRESRVAG